MKRSFSETCIEIIATLLHQTQEEIIIILIKLPRKIIINNKARKNILNTG